MFWEEENTFLLFFQVIILHTKNLKLCTVVNKFSIVSLYDFETEKSIVLKSLINNTANNRMI